MHQLTEDGLFLTALEYILYLFSILVRKRPVSLIFIRYLQVRSKSFSLEKSVRYCKVFAFQDACYWNVLLLLHYLTTLKCFSSCKNRSLHLLKIVHYGTDRSQKII